MGNMLYDVLGGNNHDFMNSSHGHDFLGTDTGGGGMRGSIFNLSMNDDRFSDADRDLYNPFGFSNQLG